MKKVTCTVIYSKQDNIYILHAIHVKHKNNNITLYSNKWAKVDKKYAYTYNRFNDLYLNILAFLKNNNMYVHKWEEFNATWYNIDFINTYTYSVDRYALKK